MKNNKDNQELKFRMEMDLAEIERQLKPERTIKRVERNLRRVVVDVISKRSGDC